MINLWSTDTPRHLPCPCRARFGHGHVPHTCPTGSVCVGQILGFFGSRHGSDTGKHGSGPCPIRILKKKKEIPILKNPILLSFSFSLLSLILDLSPLSFSLRNDDNDDDNENSEEDDDSEEGDGKF